MRVWGGRGASGWSNGSVTIEAISDILRLLEAVSLRVKIGS